MRIALLKAFPYSYIQKCSFQVVAICKEYIHYNFVFFCKAGNGLTSTHIVLLTTLVLTTFRSRWLDDDLFSFACITRRKYSYYYSRLTFWPNTFAYVILFSSFRNLSCKQLIVSTKYCKHCMFSVEMDPFFPILYHLWLHVSKGCTGGIVDTCTYLYRD